MIFPNWSACGSQENGNRKLINRIGLTGLAALISYAVAAYFCRGAFPGLFLFNGFEDREKGMIFTHFMQ